MHQELLSIGNRVIWCDYGWFVIVISDMHLEIIDIGSAVNQ